MKLSKFFYVFMFLFVLQSSLVSAVSCETAGYIDYSSNQYCGADGIFHSLKENDITCLNDYECLALSCTEGTCGSEYEEVINRTNLFETIWNDFLTYFFGEEECLPGEVDCEGTKLVALCGSEGMWEEKNDYVEGYCGYSPSVEECSDTDEDNYLIQGNCIDHADTENIDKCMGGLLIEYACGVMGICSEEAIDCSMEFGDNYFCLNGACVEKEACIPKTCSQMGVECGKIVEDNCGYLLDCSEEIGCDSEIGEVCSEEGLCEISSPACEDTCESENRECGFWKLCGEPVDCNIMTGGCLENQDCVSGKCKEIIVDPCGNGILDEGEECDGSENCNEDCSCATGYISYGNGLCVEDTEGLECSLDEIECFDQILYVCSPDLKWVNYGYVNGSCSYETRAVVKEEGEVVGGFFVPTDEVISEFLTNLTDLTGASKVYMEFFDDETDLPLEVSVEDDLIVFSFFTINIDAQISDAVLEFKLLEEDVEERDNVYLYVWEEDDNGWDKTDTDYIKREDGFYLYESIVPHFSLFMISEDFSSNDEGSSSSGGGSCTPNWKCSAWSQVTCGTRTCVDLDNCGKTVGKPEETKVCDGTYCGDGICDEIYETCGEIDSSYECKSDCGICPINANALEDCGDGICGNDESSYTCSDDCNPSQRKSRVWLFILLLVVLVGGIFLVAYLIYRRVKFTKESFEPSPGEIKPAPTPPRGPPTMGSNPNVLNTSSFQRKTMVNPVRR